MGFLRILYDLAIAVFVQGVKLAAFFDPKARLWVEGRNNWRSKLSAAKGSVLSQKVGSKTIWIHAASLGEFEQGRPVIEALRGQFPDWRIVLTFFSPSGFEIRKNYPHADLICYLPADSRRNATDFLEIIRPDVAIFVKYEFWANYLFELKKRDIPVLLISALFRKAQPFFRPYGLFWRKMLDCFHHFFVQNEQSAQLLQGLGFQNTSISGDTRVDRVLHIAGQAAQNEMLEAFQRNSSTGASRPLLIAGSSWPADEALLAEVMRQPGLSELKWVFAPHDPSRAAVEHLLSVLPAGSATYSTAKINTVTKSNALVIDNVGLLNTLYKYGHIAYIGGGFGKGIHNTLEPAAFGLPVIFGPKYTHFEEARQFVARGGAFVVNDAAELSELLHRLLDPAFYQNASRAVLGYLEESRGATDEVVTYLHVLLAGGR